MTEPVIDAGAASLALIHAHVVLVLPQAFPAKQQMYQPEAPTEGREVNETVTVGTVVSYGPGFPLNRTPL